MNWKISLLGFLLCFFLSNQSIGQVSITKFGAFPNDTLNDRSEIQKAIDFCKTEKIKQLIIPPGLYKIRDSAALQLMEDVLNGKMGKNPQDVVYTPYYPYSKGIHLNNIHQFEIIATGAIFMVEGWMEPVSIENCTNITIQGLTINYSTPPHIEGLVTQQTSGYFDAYFKNPYPIRKNMPLLRMMFWDLNKNRLLGNSIYFPAKNELINDSTLRIYSSTP